MVNISATFVSERLGVTPYYRDIISAPARPPSTCQEDVVDTLHFDTNHYNHIIWTTPEGLRGKLKNRILAVIGEGPEAHTTQ